MKSFSQFITEDPDWGYGHKLGDHVEIHEPTHEHHGKIGRIIRQQSLDYGVEVPGAKGLHWFNHNVLKKPGTHPLEPKIEPVKAIAPAPAPVKKTLRSRIGSMVRRIGAKSS